MHFHHVIKRNFLTHILWVLHDLAPYTTFLAPVVHYLWHLNGKRNEVFALPTHYCFSLKEVAIKVYPVFILHRISSKKNSDLGTNICTTVRRKLEIKVVALYYSGKLVIPNLMRISRFVQKSLKVAWYHYTGTPRYH